ncbi:hypothetical protein I4F81_003427 [Pyropia yezoensis]|uniref:Uncharacterized protein n=1 Tax=Pyropia yezoensis TaxID=2788 RepID=A0ACC3BTS5_PYRYE|nr:hypothetical protein I4F81_003427 [Neopyropia yezoensis]
MVNAGARVALGAKADTNVMSSGWPEEFLSILETTAASVLATELFERGWAILQGATAVGMPVMHMADDDGGGGGGGGGGIHAAAGQPSRLQARPWAESGTGTAGRVLSVVDATLHELMRRFPGEAELARRAKQGQRRGASARRSRKGDTGRVAAGGRGTVAGDTPPGADDGGLHVDDLWSPIINTNIDSLDRKFTSQGQGRLTVGVDALCSSDDNERHSLYLCKLAADVGMVALAYKVLRGLQRVEAARREHSQLPYAQPGRNLIPATPTRPVPGPTEQHFVGSRDDALPPLRVRAPRTGSRVLLTTAGAVPQVPHVDLPVWSSAECRQRRRGGGGGGGPGGSECRKGSSSHGALGASGTMDDDGKYADDDEDTGIDVQVVSDPVRQG